MFWSNIILSVVEWYLLYCQVLLAFIVGIFNLYRVLRLIILFDFSLSLLRRDDSSHCFIWISYGLWLLWLKWSWPSDYIVLFSWLIFMRVLLDIYRFDWLPYIFISFSSYNCIFWNENLSLIRNMTLFQPPSNACNRWYDILALI